MPPEGRANRLEAWIGSSDERQLLELYREIYCALMRTSLDTILIADAASGHIVDVNAAAQRALERAARFDDLTEIRKFTEMLHELGCTFFIDDFGSGANSIMYLTLPVSALKIDGHLIRQILADAQQRAVARAYVDLAQRMGLRTVAEGVESESLYAALRELGVDSVQGFAVARPRPLDEILNSLGSIPAVWRPTASDEARA